MKNILIIGNGIKKYIPKKQYDKIVCFNYPSEQILSISTTHWCRNEANKHTFAGAEINHDKERIYCAVNKLNEVNAVNGTKIWVRDLKYKGNPSTGLWAILHYSKLGYKIDIIGFNFNGIKTHDFTKEQMLISEMENVTNLDEKRICHFVYYTEKETEIMSENLYMSLYSFLIHHRSWNVVLWTNANFEKTKDLTGLLIMPFDEVAPNVDKYTLLAHKVDYIRYAILYAHGGMYCDSLDTITMSNFNRIYDNANKLTWSWFIGKNENRQTITYSSGWLCVKKAKNVFIKKLLDIKPEQLKQHCSFEHIADGLIKRGANGVNRYPISYKFVYPIFNKNINNLDGVKYYKQTKQFHYFTNSYRKELQLPKIVKMYFAESISLSNKRSEKYTYQNESLNVEIIHKGCANVFDAVQKFCYKNYGHLKNTVILLGYNSDWNIKEIRAKYPKQKLIIYQLEQLYGELSQWFNRNSKSNLIIDRTKMITKALNECDEIWDYDIDNIEFIKSIKLTNKPIYHKPLYKCNSVNYFKYDLVFYGSMNERRKAILKQIDEVCRLLVISQQNHDFKNYHTAIFDDTIWNYIKQSRAVLNIHYYDGLVQEQVRIFELLSNNVKVVSEKSRRNYFENDVIEFETIEKLINILNNEL